MIGRPKSELKLSVLCIFCICFWLCWLSRYARNRLTLLQILLDHHIMCGQAPGPPEAGQEPRLPGYAVPVLLAAQQSPEPGEEIFPWDWQPPLRGRWQRPDWWRVRQEQRHQLRLHDLSARGGEHLQHIHLRPPCDGRRLALLHGLSWSFYFTLSSITNTSTGCPKKNCDPHLMGHNRHQEWPKNKVGWVLKTSGFFLSNEYKNSHELVKKWLRKMRSDMATHPWNNRSPEIILFWGGSHVWPYFSLTVFHKNGEFLCSLERKKPELSKTHPTFVFRPLLVRFMAYWTRITVFFGTPCISNLGSYKSQNGWVKWNGFWNHFSACSADLC